MGSVDKSWDGVAIVKSLQSGDPVKEIRLVCKQSRFSWSKDPHVGDYYFSTLQWFKGNGDEFATSNIIGFNGNLWMKILFENLYRYLYRSI